MRYKYKTADIILVKDSSSVLCYDWYVIYRYIEKYLLQLLSFYIIEDTIGYITIDNISLGLQLFEKLNYVSSKY